MTIEVVRRFNRTYTQRIGALEESFLGLGLPLAQIRVVFEVGREGAVVRDLRERLGLDSGHLSRLLRALEDAGLLEVRPDAGDRRRRQAVLTRRGRRLLERIETRSAERAARLVDPLSRRQQSRLAEALATADLLVRAATVEIRPAGADDPRVLRALAHYADELAATFRTEVTAEPLAADHLLATSDGVPVAVGALRTLEPGVAEVKRMWVSRDWRGAGLGARLLRELEERAAATGHDVVRLDTHSALVEAAALYDRSGYRRVDRYNDNPDAELYFEKHLPHAVAGVP